MSATLAFRASVPSCSSSFVGAGSRRRPGAVRRHRLAVRAEEGAPQPSQQQLDDERRLEALEAAAKARKGLKAAESEALRGGSRPAAKAASSSGGRGLAEWKEGQLFPEGWEEMDPVQKATELWMGKRGAMYWMNQSALWSVGLLLGGWVVFRFIGPALGMYELTNTLSQPNFL